MNTIIELAVLGVILMFLGIFNLRKWIFPLVTLGLIIAVLLAFADWGAAKSFYSNMFVTDHFTVSFGSLMILATLFTALLSVQYYRKESAVLDGIYSIIIFSLLGGLVMISAGNLVTFFIGLEIMSVSLYLLAASHKSSAESSEAGMKYFLMGAFASAFVLFGITLIYGASGSLYYQDIASYSLAQGAGAPMLFKAGVLLLALGMAFKVGAVPFHFWVPDVYHGSPTIITTFMITTIKAAGFAAFLRLTMNVFPGETVVWPHALAIVAALSIILGNITALAQTRVKRMLAYSSIAHTGYILLAVIALKSNAAPVVFYYTIAYVLANLSAFAVLIVLRQSTGNGTFDAFKGLAKVNGLAGLGFAIAMFSLTGIPPLAGFMAKYNVFVLALQNHYLWLVIIAILGSAVSIYYYFRPVINSYMRTGEDLNYQSSWLTSASLLVFTILILVFGFIPGWIMSLI